MYCIDTDRLPLVYLLLVVSVLTLLTASISLDSAINLSQLQSYQEEREPFSVGTGAVDERLVVLWSYGGQFPDSSCWEIQRCTRPGKLQLLDIFKLVTGHFPAVAVYIYPIWVTSLTSIHPLMSVACMAAYSKSIAALRLQYTSNSLF